MYNISIGFNKRDFEYDVYTLVKAFYPNAEIKSFYKDEDEHPENSQLRINVEIQYESMAFSYDDGKSRECAKKSFEAAERTERKNILKRLVYEGLKTHTKTELPWGTLTGIRPAKLAMKLIEDGVSNVDIARHMREAYFVSPKKTALSIAVANREHELLQEIDIKNSYSLYVGIPFCPSICLYCSFGSHPLKKWEYLAEEYLRALFKELEYIADKMAHKQLCTIYICGCTPTTLSETQIQRLLLHIHKVFDTRKIKEFTVEAGRPDTISREKLEVLRANNVDRISINPQTMNQKTLEIIGRNHTTKQVCEAFALARDVGFENINMDLITGLPGEGADEVRATMDAIEALAPDSVTVHSLALKRATRLNLFKDDYMSVSFQNSQEIMDIIDAASKRMNMEPYYMYRQKNIAGNMENVGYAKRGCFGLYNVIIMEEKHTIMAAGSGAMSKFVFEDGRIERAENVKDLKNYIERIDEMLARKEKFIACS